MKTDADIKRNVEEQLRWEPGVDETDIAVAVNVGVVTLAGFAKQYSDKWGAEKAVKRVAGVLGIANDIEVRLRSSSQRPDPDIARDAVAAIQHHCLGYAAALKILVQNGWLTLEGEVEWDYQRGAAENTVRWLSGVKGVSNAITIKPRIAASDIKQKIESAFRRSAEVDSRQIIVESHGGTVLLKGTVRSWSEKKEAERQAWYAPGVANVDNQINVSPVV